MNNAKECMHVQSIHLDKKTPSIGTAVILQSFVGFLSQLGPLSASPYNPTLLIALPCVKSLPLVSNISNTHQAATRFTSLEHTSGTFIGNVEHFLENEGRLWSPHSCRYSKANRTMM